MAYSLLMRLVILGGLYALLSFPVIRAQSQQEKPHSCPPSCVSPDEFREMTGERVYPKIIVDAVKFDSPVHLPDSTDEPEVISELKQHMFNLGSQGLDEVLDIRIRGAWQDHGYFKVTASGQTRIISSDSTYEHVVVTIRVDPGLQYKRGDVRFQSGDPDEPLVFAREELRELVPLYEGEIFNLTKIRESLDAVKRLYDSHGYINCVSTPITDVNDGTQRISLVIEVDQGKQFRVRKVEVLGLEPSKAAALTSRVRPGDVYQPNLIQEFMKAIEVNMPDISDEVLRLHEVVNLRKSEKQGAVDIVVDFRRLPRDSSRNAADTP